MSTVLGLVFFAVEKFVVGKKIQWFCHLSSKFMLMSYLAEIFSAYLKLEFKPFS